MHRDEPARRHFLEDEPILVGLRADAVTPYRAGAVVFVEPRVEEGCAVAREDDRVPVQVQDRVGARIGDLVGKVASCDEIAKPNGEELRSRFIDRVGEEAVIGRMARRAELEEVVASRERLAVDQKLLLAARSRPANEAGMLGAGKPASIIVERSGRERRRRILILDPPAELLLQLRDQRRERTKHRVRICVLRFEMRPDVGRQGGAIFEHLAPIGRLQPIIRIADNNTVMSNVARTRRDRSALSAPDRRAARSLPKASRRSSRRSCKTLPARGLPDRGLLFK